MGRCSPSATDRTPPGADAGARPGRSGCSGPSPVSGVPGWSPPRRPPPPVIRGGGGEPGRAVAAGPSPPWTAPRVSSSPATGSWADRSTRWAHVDGRRVLVLVAECRHNARGRGCSRPNLEHGSARNHLYNGCRPGGVKSNVAPTSPTTMGPSSSGTSDRGLHAGSSSTSAAGGGRPSPTHPRPAGIAGYASRRRTARSSRGTTAPCPGSTETASNVQDLIFHAGQVRDVVVPPEGDRAVTAGDVGYSIRPIVEPGTSPGAVPSA